jgi:transcription-repair coupling factor (superfamily II helicase)
MADRFPLGLEASRLLALWREGRPLLHVTAGERRAEELAGLLRQLAPEARPEAFPPWDCLPYDWASPSPVAMGRRMAVLRKLSDPTEAPGIVVATPAAALQRVPPLGAARAFTVRKGEPLDPEALRAFCEGAGYRLDERVDEPGEVAIRGEVVDLFDPDEGWPFRIEFNGGVSAIRRYDPATQRSIEHRSELVIDAASELPPGHGDEEAGAEHRLPVAYGALATLFDHMPGARLSLAGAADRARSQALAGIAEAYRERARHDTPARRALPPERLYLTAEEWERLTDQRDAAVLADDDAEPVPAFAEERRPRAALAAWVEAQGAAGRRVALAVRPGVGRQRLVRRVREAVGRAPEPAGAGRPCRLLLPARSSSWTP